MQIEVSFDNNLIAQKVLWMLEHFKDDGVEITRKDTINKSDIDDVDINSAEYKEIIELREARINGEKTYPIDDVIKEFE